MTGVGRLPTHGLLKTGRWGEIAGAVRPTDGHDPLLPPVNVRYGVMGITGTANFDASAD